MAGTLLLDLPNGDAAPGTSFQVVASIGGITGTFGTTPANYRTTYGGSTVNLEKPGAGKVGGRTWLDRNGNGIQEGESGLPGVAVALYQAWQQVLVASTITDENGNYQFVDVPDDDYYVVIASLPPGYESYPFSPADQGVDDTLDSDVHYDGSTAWFTLGINEEKNDIDAGLHYNTAPQAMDDNASTTAGTPVSISVLANDSDPEGDPLTITAVSSPSQGTAVIDDNGTPADPTDDVIVYTPLPGATDGDSFSYDISDGYGGTSTAFVWIDLPPNSPPVATDDYASTDYATPVAIYVLGNDSDSDSDPLHIGYVTPPMYGSVVVNDNGTPGDSTDDYIVYTPYPQSGGMDYFTYEVSDGRGGTAWGNVTIDVTPNSPPVANDDFATTDYETPVSIYVLANDSDPESDPLQIGYVASPMYGSVTVDDNGTPGDTTDDFLIYTPGSGFSGSDVFSYEVSDGHGNTSWATVYVEVGAAPTGTITGRAWQDSNGDGLQDAGESGLADITVYLKDSSGMIVASVLTDSQGNYQFTDVVVGSYYLEFEIPPGYDAIFSPQDQGDDALDSDVNSYGQTDLFTLLANELVEHLDAGFVPVGS